MLLIEALWVSKPQIPQNGRDRNGIGMSIKKEAFYDATLNPSETRATNETYNIWRDKNPTKRTYLDANKLANIRR